MPQNQNAASVAEKPHTLRIADVRSALAERAMSRKQLSEKFGVTGREVAKTVYNLLTNGEADEIEGMITLVTVPESVKSEGSSRIVDLDGGQPAKGASSSAPTKSTGSQEKVLAESNETSMGDADQQTEDAIRGALLLLAKELPSLLADRRRLLKLREVLG